MPYETILSTEILADHLSDPDWLIFDCRFDLTNPDWGFGDYKSGHIPGAVYIHLNEDLSSPITPQTGRHPLPDPVVFAQKCASWGISPAKQVVVYDLTGGGFAGRLWWLLRASGHRSVALLDGGLPKWQKENRPLSTGIDLPQKRARMQAPIPFNPNLWVRSEDVVKMIPTPSSLVIDARSPERFNGEIEPIDSVAGHIPGSVNRFYGLNLNADGTFKAPETLRSEFQDILKDIGPENVVLSCGSGITSCHHILAMEIAGLPGARLYAGSWSEWIRDPSRPKVP